MTMSCWSCSFHSCVQVPLETLESKLYIFFLIFPPIFGGPHNAPWWPLVSKSPTLRWWWKWAVPLKNIGAVSNSVAHAWPQKERQDKKTTTNDQTRMKNGPSTCWAVFTVCTDQHGLLQPTVWTCSKAGPFYHHLHQWRVCYISEKLKWVWEWTLN